MSWRALREARRYVVLAALVDVLLLASGRRAGLLSLLTAAACAAFFRDPERPPCPNEESAWAAADGVVTSVAAVRDPWLEDEEAVRVSTFLSLHNVHVTRSPVAGEIALSEEVDGGLAPALFRRAEENRRSRLAIDGEAGRIVVVQIAGIVARKITSWVRESGSVLAGERLGLIHFGSRTDVLLPRAEFEVTVRAGDRVRAGITPLARRRRTEGVR